MVVTEEEFLSWKEHPVTKKLMKQIAKDVEKLKNILVYSIDIGDIREVQGRVKACQNLLEVTYLDLFDEKDRGREYE